MKNRPTTPKTYSAWAGSLVLSGCVLMVAPLALGVASAHAQSQNNLVHFNIPAQTLDRAVLAYAEQAGIQVLFDSNALSGLQGNALQGSYAASEALSRLLAGNPVTYRFTGEQQVSLVRQSDSAALQLDAITVEGNNAAAQGQGDWAYQQPKAVSVITREQLDRNPPRHAADMLVETPGVYSAVNAQDPGLSVNIRGMQDFGRVNMMIDGMRQNFNENGHQQRNGQMYVDSEMLSGAVIEKGSSSGKYGAGNIAGSVNFTTINAEDVILPGNDVGLRLRGTTGVGGRDNGVKFIGSAAVAGRFGDRWELLLSQSKRSYGEYAPGRRRPNYDFLTIGVQDNHQPIEQSVDRVRFSDQKQESSLFKGRLNITDEQSLQFSYLGTDLSYSNVSDRQVLNPVDGSVRDGDVAWRRFGSANTTSDAFSLDYAFSPASPLVDLNVKLYHVSTEGRRQSGSGQPVIENGTNMTELYWRIGSCGQANMTRAVREACQAGLSSTSQTTIDTLGFTLENTAHFSIAGIEGFSSTHGFEYFIDKGDSATSRRLNGIEQGSSGNTLNPNGERSIASLFGNLQWENDAVTLAAGMRYDRYHIDGKTRLPVDRYNLISRAEKAERYISNMTLQQANIQHRCENYREFWSGVTDEARLEANRVRACNQAATMLSNLNDPVWRNETVPNMPSNAPEYVIQTVLQDYDVTRTEYKALPTLAAAYRPTEWLEVYANWGKSWRPPALTETLMHGGHAGDPFALMFPNPHARPEESRSWDVGINLFGRGLLLPGDKFGAKVSYYDTRVDNYLITSMSNVMPGQLGGLGNVMFVPNLLPMTFRGMEFEFEYDAQRWYGRANYTHVMGSENKFCQRIFPLGAGMRRGDLPNEDGSIPPSVDRDLAEAAGYESVEAMLNDQRYCGIDVIGMNSARQLPMDRGSLVLGGRWLNQRLEIGTRLNYSAAGGPEDFDFDLWPSYITWGLFASYRVNRNILMRATMENVRDRSYVTGYSDIFSKSYGPGRTMMAGLEVQF